MLPVLDFSTIKNELFPVIAAVFSKTSSLAIKVRGLQAFVVLCGGSQDVADDGLTGLVTDNKKTSSSSALDKYTMQEKIVPLVKGIKTKEPAVMMASLNVLRIVGQTADAEFVAMDILPILWNMSLGPLLDLKQFQGFMDLIKSLSRRVEEEQTRKLQETTTNGSPAAANDDFLSFGGLTGTGFDQTNGANEDDFEALVKGRSGGGAPTTNNTFTSWEEGSSVKSPTFSNRSSTSTPQAPAFSWSTPGPSSPQTANSAMSQQATFRTITPDLGRFDSLTPSSTQFSQPIQPNQSTFQQQPQQPQHQQRQSQSSLNWAAASSTAASNPWASTTTPAAPTYTSAQPAASGLGGMNSSMSSMSLGQRPSMGSSRGSSFSLPPPPGATTSTTSFGITSPPAAPTQQNAWATSPRPMGSMGSATSTNGMMSQGGGGMMGRPQQQPLQPQQQQQPQPQQQQQQQSRAGLDKYQSLM